VRAAQAVLATRPDLRQRVQTRIRRADPPAATRTDLMLARQILRDRLLAWETWCPKAGPFPHTEHLAMVSSFARNFSF